MANIAFSSIIGDFVLDERSKKIKKKKLKKTEKCKKTLETSKKRQFLLYFYSRYIEILVENHF